MIETQLPPTAAGSLASVRPSAALAFLGPPPLIAGEDAAAYDDLLARISAALEPSDILEERQWALRDQAAVTKAEAVLASAGLTAEAVTAQTLALKIDIVERIDRMMVTAEARRNAVLREIERHRASFARTLRRAVREVEDAEDAEEVDGAAIKLIATDESVPDAARETPA
jgi:hypothetical protein